MIIFIAGISMEFSSQFGYITTRGIAAQLFLKILKSVFSKNVCMLLPNRGKPLFFWMQEFSSEQHKWKVKKKKKEFLSTFNSKRIHVRRHFAQYSYANFQIFTAAYILTFNLKKWNSYIQHFK